MARRSRRSARRTFMRHFVMMQNNQTGKSLVPLVLLLDQNGNAIQDAENDQQYWAITQDQHEQSLGV